MGTQEAREKQEDLFYASEQAEAPGHPFYQQLNGVLEEAKFDAFCEQRCRRFYHSKLGRPSLAPGVYFRLLLIGFFEGIGSERGIAWRVADSLSLRRFLKYGLNEATPDHVTISRTRRLVDEAAHQAVFTFVLTEVARRGMLKGKTIGIDATTLEANAAMRSIVRRDTSENYMEYLRRLAQEAGLNATDDELRRADRKRKKKASNDDWVNPHDPDAEVTKMKDGSTQRTLPIKPSRPWIWTPARSWPSPRMEARRATPLRSRKRCRPRVGQWRIRSTRPPPEASMGFRSKGYAKW